MRCRNCGAEILNQAKFCNKCGCKVEAPQTSLQTPQSGVNGTAVPTANQTPYQRPAAPYTAQVPPPPAAPYTAQVPPPPAAPVANTGKGTKKTAVVVTAVVTAAIVLCMLLALVLMLQHYNNNEEPVQAASPTDEPLTHDSPISGQEETDIEPPVTEEPVDTTDYAAYMGLDWIDVANVNTTSVQDCGGYIFRVEAVSNNVITYRLREISADDGSQVEITGTCQMSFGTGSCSYADVQNRYRGTLEFVFGGDKGITVTDSRDGSADKTANLYAAGSPMGYSGYLQHKQRVLVYTYGSSAQVSFEQWENGNWVVQHVASGTVGQNGLVDPQWRQEGSKTTPEGTFDLGFAFALNTLNTGLDFRQVTRNTYWVDDAQSAYYNTWQTRSANGDWSHAESLYNTFTNGKARSSIVIEFNGNGLSTQGVTKGAGSAIFFSGRSGTLKGTNGDVFITQEDMLKILPYLDKADDPVIQIHTQSDTDSYQDNTPSATSTDIFDDSWDSNIPEFARLDCLSCGGSGDCSYCDGYGYHYHYGIEGIESGCPFCHGSGNCITCGGSGKR